MIDKFNGTYRKRRSSRIKQEIEKVVNFGLENIIGRMEYHLSIGNTKKSALMIKRIH